LKYYLKEKVREFLIVLKVIFLSSVLIVIGYFLLKFVFNIPLPSFSWWSATFLSDNKIKSVITEVESSGHNIRAVQFIDAFGRVCTVTFGNSGTGLDCDYPLDRKNWLIEDYKKELK
jgi:hypothetical protein